MKKIFLIALSALVLSGCDHFKPKQIPLKGERVSVLQHDRSLSADAEVAGKQILLPAPSLNVA